MILELLYFQNNHGFINGLKQGICKAWPTIKETTLEQVKQQKFNKRPCRQAVEKLFLMKASPIEVSFKKGGTKAERLAAITILQNLLRFKGTIRIMAREPML